MFKLVVIGGKIRGKEFILSEGENVIGRDSNCDICISVSGISKRHLNIAVSKDSAYLEDLGSANGTFHNGAMRKKASLKAGDQIALPDVIMQVVFVEEKKILIQKQEGEIGEDAEDEEQAFFNKDTSPDSMPDKIKHFFKYRLMNFFYGINEEYQWRSLLGIILFLFVVITITLTIFPILKDSKLLLLHEIANRGAHYAAQIGRINARALEQKQLERVDTRFLENEEGINSYELFDLEGRIIRPLSKLNEYIEDSFSITSREWALRKEISGGIVLKKLLNDGEIGVAKKIMAYNAKIGIEEPVGIIAIHFAPRSLAAEAAKNSKAYLEAFTTSALVAIFFFGIIYCLTLRPIDEMYFQIEQALKGKQKGIETRYLMDELGPLRDSINSVFQRLRELDKLDDGENEVDIEEDENYVEILTHFMKGTNSPVIILNSEKNISHLNSKAEDLTGIRESASQGEAFLDVAREQGFAATTLDLCDRSAINQGSCQEGEYELGGYNYSIFANCLMGRDNFAKAFYITFIPLE